jgi:hypothetical protein
MLVEARMSQLSDRLEAAVLALAADGSVKQRLAQAYSQHLEPLDEQELPEELRAGFGQLREAMRRYTPVSGESAVEASVRKMSVSQCEQQAACIVGLFAALLKAGAPVERLKVVKGAGEPPAHVLDRLALRDRGS